jgi:hypothetical protein
MTIIVPHKTTQEKAIALVDKSADDLFDMGSGLVDMVDRKKNWTGSCMEFSLTAKVGFISLPVSGTVTVDATNVTIVCDLPPLAKSFIGEDKIRASVEQKIKGLLGT